MSISTGLYLYAGYLKSKEDLDSLIDGFCLISVNANKPTSKQTNRSLWYSLTGDATCRNIYELPMPFFVRAVFKSVLNTTNKNKDIKCDTLIIPDEYDQITGMPEFDRFDEFDEKKNKSAVFLLTGILCLRIRENNSDTQIMSQIKRTDIWLPPRDFNLLRITPLPETPCYVELFLHDVKYVSDLKETDYPIYPRDSNRSNYWSNSNFSYDSKPNSSLSSTSDSNSGNKPSLFNYILGKSPTSVQRVWTEFRDVFLEAK